jgi:hypothetical protein
MVRIETFKPMPKYYRADGCGYLSKRTLRIHLHPFGLIHNYSTLLTTNQIYSRLLELTHKCSNLLTTTRPPSWVLELTHNPSDLLHNHSRLLTIALLHNCSNFPQLLKFTHKCSFKGKCNCIKAYSMYKRTDNFAMRILTFSHKRREQIARDDVTTKSIDLWKLFRNGLPHPSPTDLWNMQPNCMCYDIVLFQCCL